MLCVGDTVSLVEDGVVNRCVWAPSSSSSSSLGGWHCSVNGFEEGDVALLDEMRWVRVEDSMSFFKECVVFFKDCMSFLKDAMSFLKDYISFFN